MQKAIKVFGEGIVIKILALALYLLGAKRAHIAEELQISENSIRNSLRKLFADGLPALEDRRKSNSSFLPQTDHAPVRVSAGIADDELALRFNEVSVSIPLHNRIQCRTVLLSFVNAKLISVKDAAGLLDLSDSHTRNLASSLHDNDVEVLLDKRQGQLHSFVLTPEVKSQIIAQCMAHVITGYSTSGKAIASALLQRCKLELSERTVRDCMRKLNVNGLMKILPNLIESIKKGSTQK